MDQQPSVAINPTRPVLRYYGGAWQRALWTISFFPEHQAYVEPCGGAASVLLRKPRCKLETLNDVDGRVVNFFRVLRDRPGDLIDRVRLTPWAEDEFRLARQPAADEVEDARRFFFACWMGIRGGPNAGPRDFRWALKLTRRSAPASDVAGEEHLWVAARRLMGVQILNRDALALIGKVRGTGALIYFDPPYLAETRTRRAGGYRYEPAAGWHIEAADLLCAHDGPVVVAGYPSALYADLYEARGWKRHERAFVTNSGGRRVEAVWVKGERNTRYEIRDTGDE
jgi:DNA adenine methylase